MSLHEQKCLVIEEICVCCDIELFLKNMKKHSEFHSVFIVFIPSGVFIVNSQKVKNLVRYKILCMRLKLKWSEIF